MQYHRTLGVSSYDSWKLAYPPGWDLEDEDEDEDNGEESDDESEEE